jgi:hypothetical protein
LAAASTNRPAAKSASRVVGIVILLIE